MPKEPSLDEQFFTSRLTLIRDQLGRIARAAPSGRKEQEMQTAIIQAGSTFLTALQHYIPEEETHD